MKKQLLELSMISLVGVSLGGCVSTQTVTQTQRGPLLASLKAVPAPAPALAAMHPAKAAAVLLESAIVAFRSADFATASADFSKAIETSRLNDAGRALAYWHIFLAEGHLGNTSLGSEALASFVVVAADLVEEARMGLTSSDFSQRFDLEGKLARGRATLSATWAQRSPSFGRSQTSPVPVQSTQEIHYFLALVSPCGSSSRAAVAQENVNESMRAVTMTCKGTSSSARYFFSVD